MIVIGLTGGIGMGKSTVAGHFAALGAKVCNADQIVHGLMMKDGRAVPEIGKHFPEAIVSGAVDRKKLGGIVFANKEKLKILEHILHPLVVRVEDEFIRRQRQLGAKVVVMDIPLLFETDAQSRFDVVVVATTTARIQKQRVMKRQNMTEEKFHAIVASQMPDREKRELGDVVVFTGLGKALSFRRVAQIMKEFSA